jgi:hypothetical protein
VLRALLFLLAALPTLLPPGVCACRFAPDHRADAGTASTDTLSAVSTNHCECCPQIPAGASQQVASESAPDAPEPCSPCDQHAPGCPAVVAATPALPAAPAAAPDVGLVPATRVVALVALADSISRSGIPPARASSAPLFVSHCSLLI